MKHYTVRYRDEVEGGPYSPIEAKDFYAAAMRFAKAREDLNAEVFHVVVRDIETKDERTLSVHVERTTRYYVLLED